jgi:hypothetical protein
MAQTPCCVSKPDIDASNQGWLSARRGSSLNGAWAPGHVALLAIEALTGFREGRGLPAGVAVNLR